MINRIRDVRIQQGLTLADVAARCDPPTTAQTIGRLETGTRNLSLVWMNRIAAALEVAPEALLRSESAPAARLIATLTEAGAEALRSPRDAVPPSAADGDGAMLVMAVEVSRGDYRAGDQIWLREVPPEDFPRQINRDVLVPKPGGRFAFGRLFDRDGSRIALLPPGSGQRQVVIESPPWIAVAETLIRKL
ncbi:helix-turn-helix domain-containing protein [Novosphingobium album (ex Liu et al. 2023)]|uniref:Helix-turn-helix transcriptional regulator n=1 Tax=Novosphingobium album (ex Liu et al. 2023) TaxID=3031130 RepID=A0ABT5WPW8_9SPHN|nr:helix-turn-helix transcriptional regulator [Novosphingobium album (ex Liu et al. 2023)]MDE8652100.1 helix-turn-helix transcriptional regulator [Novosphingobium album (ex Liu et al. 2023)]